jgi:hypothetical protein
MRGTETDGRASRQVMARPEQNQHNTKATPNGPLLLTSLFTTLFGSVSGSPFFFFFLAPSIRSRVSAAFFAVSTSAASLLTLSL